MSRRSIVMTLNPSAKSPTKFVRFVFTHSGNSAFEKKMQWKEVLTKLYNICEIQVPVIRQAQAGTISAPMVRKKILILSAI